MVHQHHVNEATSGKGQETTPALNRGGRGTHALPQGVQVNQSTSTCRLRAIRAVCRPHPAALPALSLTAVWPTRAGFGSRTPGTLRQKEYPEPRWAHSHSLHYKYPPGCSPDSNHNSCSLVGRRTAGLFPQEIQHNQPGMAKIMKYGYKLTPRPGKPCFSPSSCPYLASDPQRSKRDLKVENHMNETSIWSLGKTVEHSLKIVIGGREGMRRSTHSQPLSNITIRNFKPLY